MVQQLKHNRLFAFDFPDFTSVFHPCFIRGPILAGDDLGINNQMIAIFDQAIDQRLVLL